MKENIKQWTAKQRTALVLEIIQGKTPFAEASGFFDLPSPCQIEDWLNQVTHYAHAKQ